MHLKEILLSLLHVSDRLEDLVVTSNMLSFFDLASSNTSDTERPETIAIINPCGTGNLYIDHSIHVLGNCIKILSRSSRKRDHALR